MKNGRYENYGGVSYYKNDLLHREDGPASNWPNGDREWWFNGKLHRIDGPAIENANGSKEWFLNGIEYTEEEFNQWLAKKHLNERLQSSLSHSPAIKRWKI